MSALLWVEWPSEASDAVSMASYASVLPQADVYSFAMICYELFEGSKPFGQMDAMSAARAASLFDRRPSWGKVNR